ncbi:g12666 [Coccomyxa viridis]|uniref:G12666 protein n=1 Tax=Coccomyxa viridis TaxID=1274662 RepID=A0ABP1GAX0_9CHLO
MATKSVGTFLVPDVSGEAPSLLLEAARATAAAMSSFELIAEAGFLEAPTEADVNIGEAKVSRLVIESGIAAIDQPAKVLIPATAAAHTIRILSLFAQILLDSDHLHAARHHMSRHLAHRLFDILEVVDHGLLGLSEVGVIVFTIWFLLAWKERLLDVVVKIEKRRKDKGKGGAANLERLLLPLSSLSGWGLTAVGALMVIHVLGFNIQPLLTVGGVGGLAFGFGAQAVTSNAISGLNLFLTRPFVVGDKVELKTQTGGSVLHGTVVRIEVMRTIVRTEAGIPVAIPNKAVTEMIVSNESLAHPDSRQAGATTPAAQ